MIAGGAIGGAIVAGTPVRGGTSAPIKIAFVGCGRRARELADAVLAVENESVNIVALADAFPSQTQAMYRSLKGRYARALTETCLRTSGIDCLKPILQSDADIVYLTTPPAYRSDYFRNVIKAGKHAFLEKPLAADVSGVLEMTNTAQLAKETGLSVHVGFQRRYDTRYQDIIAQVHQGAIGTPVFARAFCNAGPLRKLSRNTNETEADFQLRNWNHFQWTGGDFLVEQHVAGLDVIRWALGQTPMVAQGQGGWGAFDNAQQQASNSERQGEVFDHHSIEYEFQDGAILLSQCRRIAKAWNNTSEHIHGTTGRADLAAGKIVDRDQSVVWQSDQPRSLKSATLAQQTAFLQSVRGGIPDNQVESAAESTLLAMLGHQATRTGKRIRMDKMLKEASGS